MADYFSFLVLLLVLVGMADVFAYYYYKHSEEALHEKQSKDKTRAIKR